jgi:two-component SAPR family response regulator
MPQMTGPELARKMLEVRPGTKIVYMSGYTDDALGHHGVLDPDIILLPKPFTPEALIQHLRPRAGRIREARLAQRTFRVPRTTGASGSITKRMRGRSVSEVETLAEIGVVKVIGAACHAAASNRLT